MNLDAGRMWWGRGGVVALVVGAWVLSGVPFVGAEASAAAPGDPVCTIRGTARAELLRGTSGADVICGLGGDDQLMGLGGNDALFGGGGDDVVVGGAGNDLLRGAAGNDVEFGGGGNDRLRNWAGADRLSGGAGNDHLRGGQGADVVMGGPGRDVATYAGHTVGVRASIGTGADDGRPGEGDNIGADVENLRGGIGNDTLIGSAGPNQLFGTAGNDRVTGLAGSDLLDGGGGRDVLNALDGFVDVLSCGGGAGDRAIADMSDRVGAGCETVVQNDAPVAVDDHVTSNEDTVLVLPVTGAGSPAANDTDVDGDTLTVTTVSAATGGSAAIVAGMIRFVPAAELCGAGVAGFDYRVSDGGGGTDVGEVTVTVTCVDDPPTAVPDSATAVEDSDPTAIDVLANDTDIDDGPITVDDATQPTNGTVVVAAGGADLTYQPDANYCNTQTGGSPDTFTYTLNGGSTATVSVTVTCVPDTPVAVDDTATVAEASGATTIDVLANDDDPDPVGITIDSVTQPTNGTVVVAVDGADLTYQPDADYCNTQTGGSPDTFTYTLTPGGSTATVSVTVTCVDDPPTAVPDSATVIEDDPATTIDVLANDTDIDDGPITVDQVTQPTNGTVVITDNGDDLTYQPDADYCNTQTGGTPDTFTYTLAPGGSTATVTVTVTCVPDTPVAIDDTATVAEDSDPTTIDVLANDDDPDPVGITIDSATQPTNGTVVVAANGAGLTYQPDPNYCNTQTGGSPDTFTYTLTPGGSTATVTVTVTCVPDTPVANDDTATVAEDAAATTIDVLANDDDPDPVGITIDDATQPANGTVVVAADGADLTYQPDANYCNTQTGGSPDTFTYTLTPGGSTATVSVTVTCVDDPPTAVNDTATMLEDDPATTIDVLANDTDSDDGPITVDQVTQPTNGTVVITNSGDDLSYQPDPNYCNTQAGGSPDTFTYTLAPGGSTATVAVTVTCVAEDPVAVDDTETVAEDSGATTIDVLANDVDADSVGMTIDSTTEPANGTVVITNGGDDVTYQPDPDYCNTQTGGSPDTFTYTLTPGGSTATVSVTVTCVDDPPTAVNDTATVTEDDPATTIDVLANDLDIDDGPITIDQVTQPANGDVVITNGGDDLTYQPDANYCNTQTGGSPDTFTYTLTPGGSTATVSVTVTCVNDLPVAVNDTATVLEDAAATAVLVLNNDTDIEGDAITITSASEPANGTVVLTGGSPGARTGLTYQPDLNYCNTQPAGTPDTFTYTVNGGDDATVSVTVTCVDDPPVAVNDTATVAEDDPATAITVLNNDTDVDGGPKAITAITQPANGDVVTTGGGTGLTYQPDPNYCNTQPAGTPDTFTYTLTPGSSTATVSVTVTCVDDPPVAVNDTATVLEDAAATPITVLVNDTDIDAGPTTITTVTQPGNGTVAITGGGTGLTYQPATNYCNNPPGTTPDTFTYTLNGGSTATVSVTVTCVNDPPIAGDDSFTGANAAVGNTALVVDDPTDGPPTVSGPHKSISGDILANDADNIDGPGPLVVVAGTFATTEGGSVTIQADGDFVYTPAAGCTDPTDSFNYTVSDQNTPVAGTDTGTVTISISNCVWYVSNNAPGNSGTSTAPFDTLAQAETASAAGHTIFVFDGDNTTTGYAAGFTLKANQVLTSEAVNLSVGGALLHNGVPANRPTITDNNADVIELSSGNTVTGINIDPQGTGGGIAGGSGDAGGTISDVNIIDATPFGGQPGLELDATTGTWNLLSNLTVSTNGAIGVRLNNAGTINFTSAGTISITTAGARALDAAGASTSFGAASVIDAITVTGSGTGAVGLTATTGTLALGDGSGTDLALTTTSGATAALFSTHTGTLSVDAAGTDNISATVGPAVDITGAGTFDFDDVDSTNSSTDGINLDAFGTGTFTALSGNITGAAGIAFDLNGGSGAVTYPGNLNNGTGATADITGRSGGTVTLSGQINDTNDAGGGITLTGNTGGTTAFTNATKTLNTTTGNAVTFTTSNGHTLSFTGGNLDIDTTSGQGINANDAGTITVTGTGNSITSTTGTALNIVATDIGAADVTFQSISANGGANGIVLNGTGSAGGLTVTGSGGACTPATPTCTGGTIQNTTGGDDSGATPPGTGIVLNNTQQLSLTNMRVRQNTNYGIRGDDVTGFSFANGLIDGVNGTNVATPFNDGSINLDRVVGAISITGSDISGGFQRNIKIDHPATDASATATITITGNSIHDTSSSFGDDGIIVEAENSDNYTVNVSNNTFARHGGDHVNVTMINNAVIAVTISNNTLTGGHPVGLGQGIIVFGANWNGSGTYAVSNNTINGNKQGGSIHMNKGSGTATFSGTISGNVIGTAGVVGSGSEQAFGIIIGSRGAGGSHTSLITSNTIRQYFDRGIVAQAGEGNASLNITVTGNTVTEFADAVNSLHGIHLDVGILAADAGSVCADIGGAGTARNNATNAGNEPAGGVDIRVRRGSAVNLQLRGYTGGSEDDAAVNAYLLGRNDATTVSATSPGTGTTTNTPGGAACPQP